jgi:lipopolysaccharide export system permease protein
VLATIGGLTRTGELVVMRSCGVSLYRAALPLFALALVWSGGLFMLDDRVLARANREAEALDTRIKGGTPALIDVTASNWLIDSRGRIYHFSVFDAVRQTMHGVSIFEPDDQWLELVSHTSVSRATFTSGGWRAERGWVQRFADDGRTTRETFIRRRLDLDPPDQFAVLQNQDAEMMTYGELRQFVNERGKQGLTVVDTRLTLEERIAFPIAALVMTILGVPFGATTGRRGSLYGVGLALILGVGYWLTNTFFLAVGEAGLLPPMLAAWTANLMFLALAAYMTLTVRT